MTEKRFGIVKTKSYELYVPTDEQKIYNFSGMESELDCMRIVNALNELNDENNRIKQTIQEAYENERTNIGKNVLKQLLEAIQ